MRVLHTSDWHLGISRDTVSRREDHSRFLAWLRETIRERGVDVLLVAGDIFDTIAPSAETQRQLYGFLGALRETPLRRAILIGGNHDSAAQLDAPRGLLSALNIDVLGSYRADEAPQRHLCPIRGPSGDIELAVAAVPFVHEFRLGIRTTDATRDIVHARLVQRFRDVYDRLAEHSQQQFGTVPLVAMGHLTCGSATRDDYPHEVHQVGTLGSLPADVFDSRYRYVALGHLHHRRCAGRDHVHYCGTPVALNLREAASARCVLEFDSGAAQPTPQVLRVPPTRDLVELTGVFDEVAAQLETLSWTTPLRPLVYLRVTVDSYDPTLAARLYEINRTAHATDAPPIVELRQVRRTSPQAPPLDDQLTRLRDLEPEEVFRRLCRAQGVTPQTPLLAAFRTLLNPSAESTRDEPPLESATPTTAMPTPATDLA
ncbi:MAG: exonuclease subunit SbcD [Myxococcales bacterium FL481]|nr:MAG: exonuclease subunit SbcD [Myxococcales bacterium FL481]